MTEPTIPPAGTGVVGVGHAVGTSMDTGTGVGTDRPAGVAVRAGVTAG